MQSVLLTEADNGKSLSLAVGDTLSLSLPESPTTGYRWQLDSPGAAIISPSGDSLESRGAQVGGGGTRVVTFRLVRPGNARLLLKLRRSWEPADRFIKEFSVNLDVKG